MPSIVEAEQYLFTSESVTEGHPDKMCDQVSDAILDAIIADDPNARVACEAATTTGLVMVLGEITTSTYVDFQAVVRDTVRDIGYTRADYGFDYLTCGTLVSIKEQSKDISMGVDSALEVREDAAPSYELRESDPVMHVNPTGRFVTGGPMGDAGLTGRKIIVDSYGGMARHGGGAFSGKDPTKVDRSAAYAARWVAKNVVAAGLADRFEVEVAYGIGIARPISFSVDSFGTGRIEDSAIQALIERHFDLRPASIIAALDLRRPLYRQTAAYGHFGRPDLDLPWERTDKAAILSADAGIPQPEPAQAV